MPVKTKNIHEIFCCPYCGGSLSSSSDILSECVECKEIFQVKENIPVFNKQDLYWCNFPKEVMTKLNKKAEEEGYEKALEDVIEDKDIREYMVEEGRIDPLFFLPVTKDSVVLDVGCKWGGLTIPVSGYCKTIVGIDATYETVKFLDIRKRQMKKDNIHLASASALEMPFKENSFDVVILNGVLEWLGYGTSFDATKDYGTKVSNLKIHNEKPDKMQKKALENIYRVLKPGGVLLIGIENRFGLHYFFGMPEDHANLKYVGLMPRGIANWYMKKKLNREFRTYTYSMPALRNILKSIGFNDIEFFASFPSYREPDYIFSLGKPELLKYFMKNHNKSMSKNPVKRAIWSFLVNTGLYKFFVPSFLVIAGK
ncbi:MAG: class I SAM-dependent methyltransferase [Armatimonadota bacterium]